MISCAPGNSDVALVASTLEIFTVGSSGGSGTLAFLKLKRNALFPLASVSTREDASVCSKPSGTTSETVYSAAASRAVQAKCQEFALFSSARANSVPFLNRTTSTASAVSWAFSQALMTLTTASLSTMIVWSASPRSACSATTEPSKERVSNATKASPANADESNVKVRTSDPLAAVGLNVFWAVATTVLPPEDLETSLPVRVYAVPGLRFSYVTTSTTLHSLAGAMFFSPLALEAVVAITGSGSGSAGLSYMTTSRGMSSRPTRDCSVGSEVTKKSICRFSGTTIRVSKESS